MKLTRIALTAAIAALTACNNEPDHDASGYFEATEVTLSAETAGKILDFSVEEGDTVTPGRTLALIDTTQLDHERRQLLFRQSASEASRPDVALQLAAMRRELGQQQRERSRIEALLADGAATSKQLDDINAAISILTNRIEAQESTLSKSATSINESNAAIAMQIQQLNDRIDDCHICSPIAGTVITKYAEKGEYVVPGKPLLKIADLNRIYLRAYFTGAQLADISLGREVTVIANFGGDKTFSYPGRITWISAESEFTPKNIQNQDSRANLVYAVKITVSNDGRLKIGTFGNVKL